MVIGAADRAALVPLWEERRASVRVVSRGRMHEPLGYPMLAAIHEDGSPERYV